MLKQQQQQKPKPYCLFIWVSYKFNTVFKCAYIHLLFCGKFDLIVTTLKKLSLHLGMKWQEDTFYGFLVCKDTNERPKIREKTKFMSFNLIFQKVIISYNIKDIKIHWMLIACGGSLSLRHLYCHSRLWLESMRNPFWRAIRRYIFRF